jgi:hypothetical protein
MLKSDAPIVQSHLELEEKIRKRAKEIWQSHRDRNGDTALDDWLEAEREVLGKDPHQPAQDRGTVVGPGYPPDPGRIEELGEA